MKLHKKAHVRRQLIESLDERDQATIQDIVGQLLNPEEIGTPDYLAYLKQVVLTLGHQGDVVIVGHAARFILPAQFGLSVRMVAPIEVRTRRIADKARLSLDAARVEVERTDRERVIGPSPIWSQCGRPFEPRLDHQHAALNVEAAAEVVITALQRKLGVRSKRADGNNKKVKG